MYVFARMYLRVHMYVRLGVWMGWCARMWLIDCGSVNRWCDVAIEAEGRTRIWGRGGSGGGGGGGVFVFFFLKKQTELEW